MAKYAENVFPLFVLASAVPLVARAALGADQYLFFMKAPTEANPVGGFLWQQQVPESFSVASFESALSALNITDARQSRVGLTFQWELLDCFLSPHDCNTSQTLDGIRNFLASAVACNVPVAIVLDPVQFYYESNLWNWFDPAQPGYDPGNVANVEWSDWTAASAAKLAWRDWGSQFRMPTPQANLGSSKVLNAMTTAVEFVLTGIRQWYESQPWSAQELLVAVKLCEELDVGANFYFYENGNSYFNMSPANDPTNGLNSSRGLAGGLAPQGFNMLQTLNLRSSGGPPTRQEISEGLKNYFQHAVNAASNAWPALGHDGAPMLALHLGWVGDPLLNMWSTNMVAPAVPAYSFYFDFGQTPGQPGLATALLAYNASRPWFAAGEFTCFSCTTPAAWAGTLSALFASPLGHLRYASVYNLAPFVRSPGAVDGLHAFLTTNP